MDVYEYFPGGGSQQYCREERDCIGSTLDVRRAILFFLTVLAALPERSNVVWKIFHSLERSFSRRTFNDVVEFQINSSKGNLKEFCWETFMVFVLINVTLKRFAIHN